MGCYLTYEDTSSGSLHLNWSQTEVEGYLGYFKPTKSVPKFKFKAKGGKSELTRSTNNMDNGNYFTAWCNYVKMAKQYRSTLVYVDNNVQLFTHNKSKIGTLGMTTVHELELLECIGAVPSGGTIFDGVATTSRGNFINKCQSGGAALTLPAW